MDKIEKENKSDVGKKKNGKKRSFLASLMLRLCTVAVVAAALFFGGRYGLEKFKETVLEKKHAMVERQLLDCAELVTCKMHYSDIITMKKKGAFGNTKSFAIIRYKGILRAGLKDVSRIKFYITDEGKKIKIRVPAAELLGNDILYQEIFDEQQSLFKRITTQEIFSEIENARKEAAMEIIEEGFLDEADSRVDEVLVQMMHNIGFTEIKIEKM